MRNHSLIPQSGTALSLARRRLKSIARCGLVFGYYAATVLLELAGRGLRRLGCVPTRRILPANYSPGVSLIVPERGNAGLLRECLAAAIAAAQRLSEPWEIIAIMNGSGAAPYRELEAAFPAVQFAYFREPIGFSRAIEEGLKRAGYDWVYLLNNDMVIEPGALEEVMKWRAPHVFAVASQIFFRDQKRRREETGWTDFELRNGWVEIFDVPPEEPEMVRGNFYAGGGASLFRKSLLARLLDRSHPYDPFYWEDVEWGALAWRLGYETLFCPASRAWHYHRATVSKFYTPAEVEAIFRRNNYRYQMRNLNGEGFNRELFRWLLKIDGPSLRVLLAPGEVKRTLMARAARFTYPMDESILRGRRDRYYPRRDGHSCPSGRAGMPVPTLLVVSPFAVYPPLHGSAVRIDRLLRTLCEHFHVILLSDEGELYGPHSMAHISRLAGLHLVNRGKEPAEIAADRIARIRRHCHPALRQELARLLELYQPAAVEIEHVELAALINLRRCAPRAAWVLVLHDVLFSEGNGRSRADRYEEKLIEQFDAAVACSPEDAALLRSSATLVPNGVDFRPDCYTSSRSANAILFLGPFRYAPNLAGISLFAERVFPEVRRQAPGVELWVLGGTGAPERASRVPALQAEGIKVFEAIEDVGPFLRRCALTINPVRGSRGSSIKLIQSIAAGRVCISTADGARGFADTGLRALVTVPGIEDMTAPLIRLLRDEDLRVRLEQESLPQTERFDWRYSGQELLRLINRLTT